MTAIRSILYATDFSTPSAAAFPLAAALARDYRARLIIAHVRPVPTVAYSEGNMALVEPETAAAEIRKRLQQFDPQDAQVAVDYLVKEGDPATEILDIARQQKCDFIVIGTHGRTGLWRLLAGSVAEQVMRYAPCPVLTVRSPAPETPPTAPEEPGAKTPEDAFTMKPYLP